MLSSFSIWTYIMGALLYYTNKKALKSRKEHGVKSYDMDKPVGGRMLAFGIYDAYLFGFSLIISFLPNYIRLSVFEVPSVYETMPSGQAFLLSMFYGLIMIGTAVSRMLFPNGMDKSKRNIISLMGIIASVLGSYSFHGFLSRYPIRVLLVLSMVLSLIAAIMNTTWMKWYFHTKDKHSVKRGSKSNSIIEICEHFDLAALFCGIILIVGSIVLGIVAIASL